MHWKLLRLLALGGFSFILLAVFYTFQISTYDTLARAKDDGLIIKQPYGCPKLEVQINIAGRVMSEAESKAITATFHNPNNFECSDTITFSAPRFEISPSEPTSLFLAAGETAELTWVIAPERSGTFTIAINSEIRSHIVGVSVTNELGLTVQQAQIMQIVGYFLGPALTLPWIYALFQERRKAKQSTPPVQTKTASINSEIKLVK